MTTARASGRTRLLLRLQGEGFFGSLPMRYESSGLVGFNDKISIGVRCGAKPSPRALSQWERESGYQSRQETAIARSSVTVPGCVAGDRPDRGARGFNRRRQEASVLVFGDKLNCRLIPGDVKRSGRSRADR